MGEARAIADDGPGAKWDTVGCGLCGAEAPAPEPRKVPRKLLKDRLYSLGANAPMGWDCPPGDPAVSTRGSGGARAGIDPGGGTLREGSMAGSQRLAPLF